MLKKIIGVSLLTLPTLAVAETVEGTEVGYIINTFAMLMSGILVFWMKAGFAMLEAGSVRSKNAAVICLKNISVFSISALIYYAWGYSIMYSDVGSFIGSFADVFVGYNGEQPGDYTGTTKMADFFFQLTFVAATASIISGAVAERVRISGFMLFTLILTGLIYPIVGAMTWGGGYLASIGFHDFAGTTIVHSTGGWAALVGVIMLGARKGRFDKETAHQFVPSHVPMVTIGTLILWMGWYGFNGGSVLVIDSATNIITVGHVYVVTTLGAASGVIAAYLYLTFTAKIVDVTLVLNAALAGLVSVTGGADLFSPTDAVIIGAVGGILTTLLTGLLATLKIDDVVAAIPVHLGAGIWGTLAVAIFGGGSYIAQLTGIVVAGAFVVVSSLIGWYIVKLIVGIRASDAEEIAGLDISETGLRAYPEWQSDR